MKRKIELLAPGGDIDSIKSAILAGADAVYCGLNKFNARNRAANISFEELQGILRLAHQHQCKVFLTLNIILLDSEIPALIKLLNRLVNTSIDGVIVQDLGLLYILSKYFPRLKIHASTQLTTHNKGQILFLKRLNAERINLSRELNLYEIKELTAFAHAQNIRTEVFVHGSYCISFSGICYMSSVHGGNSGNRGRCSQPCRERYVQTAAGKDFPLNLKDNSAYFDVQELLKAGVDSLKIEGRIKEFEYVYTVVTTWKKQLLSLYENERLLSDNSALYKVFNRDFSNGYLKGKISKDMFIDDPMSQSTKYLSKINNYSSDEELNKDKATLYEEKKHLRTQIRTEIKRFDLSKIPLTICISGECGAPLKIAVKGQNISFELLSDIPLTDVGTEALSHKMFLKRLNAISETDYTIENTDYQLARALYLPFKELNTMKKSILSRLNACHEMLSPIKVPVLKKGIRSDKEPKLSVLISSVKDLNLCADASIDVYYELPDAFRNEKNSLLELFQKNKSLKPCFPSILIGDDYLAAKEFLVELHPNCIITNNTGIAFDAYQNGIQWIAGPYLNIVNSYSLICLQEKFNCSGAFLSNEIAKKQIMTVKKPEGFQLYYSIFHPIVLMTSRQCLLQQVSGCAKSTVDDHCMQECERTAIITNLKDERFIVEKSKGKHQRLFSAAHSLNTELLQDFPDLFSSLFIDLRDIKTETKMEADKAEIIRLFKNYLKGDIDAAEQIHSVVCPSLR